ncbi:hypothetical protein [Streptomyces afghaniensis 772] [Streptomyces afghaniensis]
MADSPAGPFKDALGKPPEFAKGGALKGQMIDPSVFTDDDGQALPVLGQRPRVRRAAERRHGVLRRVEGAGHHPDNFREGSFVIKRKGTYYFMWSEDSPQRELPRGGYATGLPLGPWTKRGTHPPEAARVRHPRHRSPRW